MSDEKALTPSERISKYLDVMADEKRDPPPKRETEQEVEDYDYTRKILKEVLDMGRESVAELKEIASQTGEPTAYEKLSTLIKTVTDGAIKVMETNKIKKVLEQTPPKKDADKALPPPQPQQTQNNVFIGTTSDVLKKIREKNIQPLDVLDGEDV